MLETLINEKAELLRPGFTRLSLNFTLTAIEIHYVLSSILWICKHGYKLCGHGLYAMNARSGEWRHHTRQSKPLGNERLWLTNIDDKSQRPYSGNTLDFVEIFRKADELLQSLGRPKALATADLYDGVRWFMTSSDCAQLLLSNPNVNYCPVSDTLNGAICVNGQKTIMTHTENSIVNNLDTKLVVYSFRDGEFTGEAPMGEIIEGHESGELSSDCIVFVEDEWQKITTLLIQPIPQQNDLVIPKEEKVADCNSSDIVTATFHLSEKELENEHETSLSSTDEEIPLKPINPPKKLLRSIQKATIEHDMIMENDVLLLGLSGGKDSLSLLHILIFLQKKLPQKFSVKVLTVDPGSSGYDPSSLISYLARLRDGYGKKIEYHYVKDDIMGRAYSNNFGGNEKKRVTSICAYCARMKRGIMYSTMRKCGANKLVLAQHLDDAAESTMMSIMHNGFLRTMKAHYVINMGDLAVIRPLIYTRESELTKFALENQLPIINENCPACFEEPKERARIKKLLAREEGLFS